MEQGGSSAGEGFTGRWIVEYFGFNPSTGACVCFGRDGPSFRQRTGREGGYWQESYRNFGEGGQIGARVGFDCPREASSEFERMLYFRLIFC